jgi:hypothetical protein
MRTLILLCVCLLAGSAFAAVPEGWAPFVIGEIAPESLCNVSSYSPGPAGAEGFVSVSSGHYLDGGGKRLRFLATNATFASAFPDKELAPKIAQRMAALGINCVRFHHMDNQYKPAGIWDKAYKDKQHLDAEQLDRLDWFIYQLKLNGIYSNLNLHVSRDLGEADGVPNPPTTISYDKGVDNFNTRMIELQRNYARDLLTHVNPYTKTAYVNEPAVAMVELNNENSLLGFALSGPLSFPEPFQGELAGYWHDWLKTKYKDTAGLRKAWDEGSEPLGAELLRNRDFSRGTADWTLESKHPGVDVFEVVDDPAVGKALHAKLVELGVNPWDFQIHQVGHNLMEGQVYTLSFKIKASPKREVHVGARYDEADWRGIGLEQAVTADDQWRSYSFSFRAKEPRPKHNRISFNAQNSLGDVWLADISLKPGGILGLPADQTLEAGNIVFPSSNSTAKARQDWFAFLVDVERKYTQGMYRYLKDDLKLRAPVIDTQGSYGGLGGLWRESQLDYIDNHAYWQHPHFPGKPWDGSNWYINNTPMTAALGSDVLTNLAMMRVAGKAYTISEYNHPAPNDYRAECMPMLAAFAALQDWDGVFEFDYGSTPPDWTNAKIAGYFQMVSDPAKLAWFPIAANLLRRGDLQPAHGETRLRVPKAQVIDLLTEYRGSVDGIWQKAGVTRKAAVVKRLAVEFTDTRQLQADPVAVPEQGPVVSDNQQLSWQADQGQPDVFTVDMTKTKVVLGHVAGTTVKIGGVNLDIGPTSNGWVAVGLTSMDNLPLAQSKRILLVAMSKVENQDMMWSTDRKTVGNKWGTGPSIIEQVSVQAQIGARKLQAYPLDGSGKRAAAGAGTVWWELSE